MGVRVQACGPSAAVWALQRVKLANFICSMAPQPGYIALPIFVHGTGVRSVQRALVPRPTSLRLGRSVSTSGGGPI